MAQKLVFEFHKPVFATKKEVIAIQKEDSRPHYSLFSRRKEDTAAGKDVFGLSNALFQAGKPDS